MERSRVNIQDNGTGSGIESEAFARAALDGLTAHIAVLDETGVIILVNRSWRAFAEANGPGIEGVVEGANYLTVCDAVLGNGEAAAVARGIRSIMSGEQEHFSMEYPCHSPTEQRWFNVRVTRFPGKGRARAIVAHEDISQRKRAEESLRHRALELARATRALERSNHELDQFAYVTSHDLKAPLRGIANLSRWIEEDLEDKLTDETRRHLEMLRGRVDRMEAMIEGILQYSRIGRVVSRTDTVDVGALLREVVDLLAPPPEVKVDIGSAMPTLITDRLRLQQVFMNLISNAIKHAKRPDVHIKVCAADEGDRICFRVADNGAGIAPEFHDKIFEFFQTLEARDRVEGTGIGLSLVKKIIENQGGSIHVDSSPGSGATFYFTIPKDVPRQEDYHE